MKLPRLIATAASIAVAAIIWHPHPDVKRGPRPASELDIDYAVATDNEPYGKSSFSIKPYLQWGDRPATDDFTIVWSPVGVAPRFDAYNHWSVEKKDSRGNWVSAGKIEKRTLQGPEVAKLDFLSCVVHASKESGDIPYRVRVNDSTAFEAIAHPKHERTSYHFDVFGDAGFDTPEQRQVAFQVYKNKPDFVVMPGDLVYTHGTLDEYLAHFFNVYNTVPPSPANGAPLLRSTIFVAAPGNHDISLAGNIDAADLDRFPNGLAYFYLWRQPLDGPAKVATRGETPILECSPERKATFLKAADGAYPVMANFSFDYSNCHFAVLDADPYMDWTDSKLRHWLQHDLDSTKKTWKFVMFHQPGFNSDITHFSEQRMRLLADIFERSKVDIVFSGHVHNYQRSMPMRFTLQPQADGSLIDSEGSVAGSFTLDKKFDGVKVTKPHGVIYLISGGGGAPLSGRKVATRPDTWQPFTAKFIAAHGFTQCQVDGNKLSITQIDLNGKQLDKFAITKESG
jgi:hypothetical protein